MIRYFFISGVCHGLVLGLLSIQWGTHQHAWQKKDRAVTVELLSMVEPGDAPVTNPLIEKKKTKKTIDRLAKDQSSEVEENLKDLINLESNEGNSQKAQAAKLTYTQELNLYIRKHKFYPRAARRLKQTGVVQVKLVITPSGYFRNVRLHSGSNHERLNRAAVKLIKDLKKYKPLPEELRNTKEFVVPIAYQINNGGRS